MGISHSEAYAAAGVNIEAGYEGVKLMKKHVQRTMIPGVVSDLGGFGGGYPTSIPKDGGKDRFECKISEGEKKKNA